MSNANLETLKTEAAAQVAHYPQYAGHFAPYVVERMKRTVTTKAGTVAVNGEAVLVHPATRSVSTNLRGATHAYVTVWSLRNKVDTSVRCADVELSLGTPGTR